MKRTEEILGFPVIDISTGERVGRVKDIIFNGDSGTVDYLVIQNDAADLMARVVSTEDVLGIGEYAVTIGSEDSIRELNSTVDAVKLLQKGIKVKNTGILTKKGTIIGQTGDVYLDEDDSCRIVGLEFIAKEDGSTEAGRRILPADTVITYGRNLIIVDEDAVSRLVRDVGLVGRAASRESSFGGNNVGAAAWESSQGFGDVSDNLDTEVMPEAEEAENTESAFPAEEERKAMSAADLFEQRQRQYLIGRRASKRIVGNDGKVIVEEGMIINNEIIDDAKKNGKLVELVMNNRE